LAEKPKPFRLSKLELICFTLVIFIIIASFIMCVIGSLNCEIVKNVEFWGGLLSSSFFFILGVLIGANKRG